MNYQLQNNKENKMQREFDKLDVDLKFMDLAIKIFELIEAEIKKGVSIADLNRLARTMLLVQKSVKSMKIPKTDRTLMRNMNSVAKMMDALNQLEKKNSKK
jgi:F0F1-type ATP synthase beta subunit